MERLIAVAAGVVFPIAVALAAPEGDIPELLRGNDSAEKPGITISTNAVGWGFAVINARIDVALSERISIGTPVYYSPWFAGNRHAVRVLGFQPEVRWWSGRGVSGAGERQTGHFLGAHATVAWYNVKWGDMRYQDRGRPALGAGVSYGYRLMLTEGWGMEFTLGAGVVNTRYDRFYNTKNGRLADTRQTTYFGIDNLGVSVSYSW